MSGVISYIEYLRNELKEALRKGFPNNAGGIVINASVREINVQTDLILERFGEEKLEQEERKERQIIHNYIKKIEEDKKSEDLKTSRNALNAFLYQDSDPQIDKLHTYTVYLGYMGWYHFVDEINKEKSEKEQKQEMNESDWRDFHTESEFNSFLTHYSKTLRESSNKRTEVLEQVFNLISNNLTKKYLEDSNQERSFFLNETFNLIIQSSNIEESVGKRIKLFLGDIGRDNGYKWYDRSLIASALTISILNFYDETKADYLILLLLENEKELNSDVWQKSLIGLVLALFKIFRNKRRIHILKDKLIQITHIPRVKRALPIIIWNIFNISPDESLEHNFEKIMGVEEPYRRFVPFNKEVDLLEIAFKCNQLNIDIDYFAKLLSGSISLSNCEKYKTAIACQHLDESKIEELILVFEEELNEFELLRTTCKEEEFLDIEISHLLGEIREFLKDTFLEEKEEHQFTDAFSVVFNAHESIGDYFKENGNYQKALTFYEQQEGRDAYRASTLWNIIYCCERESNFEKALEYHLKIQEIDPDSIENLRGIGKCLSSTQNNHKALEYHLKAYDLDSTNVDNLVEIGICLQLENEYEEAVEFHLKAFLINPLNVENLEEIVYCLKELGEYQKAYDYLLKIIDIVPNDTYNLKEIGYILQELGDYEKAFEYHEKALELEPKVRRTPFI